LFPVVPRHTDLCWRNIELVPCVPATHRPLLEEHRTCVLCVHTPKQKCDSYHLNTNLVPVRSIFVKCERSDISKKRMLVIVLITSVSMCGCSSRVSQDPQILVPVQDRPESIGPNTYKIDREEFFHVWMLFRMNWDQRS